MHVFLDELGRQWAVTINVAAIRRVRAMLDGLDLPGLMDGGLQPLGEFLQDPVKLVDALYVLCRHEADARGISDEQFGEGMYGDAIERGADTFVAELIDFFPAAVRARHRKSIEVARKIDDKAAETAMAALAEIDARVSANGLNGSSGSTPASSESTPAPSPSASLT